MAGKRKVSVQKIYDLAIEGMPASKIARLTGVSRQRVSIIIKQLEQGGYIRCIASKGNPKQYDATKKIFNRSVSTMLSPVVSTRSCGRHEIVKIQKCSFKFKIVIPPAIPVKWDREYPWANNNSVMVQQYSHPFDNMGIVVFRRFKSEDEDYLMVILPQLMLPEDELGNAEAFLTQLATMSGAWVQKTFKLRLGLPEITQKPHYAVVPHEAGLVKAFKSGSYKVGEMMGDSSPPDKLSEIESTDPRDIVNYLHSVNKIKTLEDELQKSLAMQRELMNTVSEMAKAQKEFFESMGMAKGVDVKREQESIDKGIA